MSSYLVTGGAGFIGSNIVETLIQKGESVRVLDNCSTGKMSNLKNVMDRIEFIHGDIRDLSLVRDAVKNVDYVIHLAALASVPWSIDDPITNNDINIAGTLNILVAAKDASVKRVVYTSSSAVYGDSPESPKTESMPANPISPYAISKHTGEQYCKAFYQLYGLETVTLRYFNVFGQRQDPNSQYAAVIPIFINSFLEGRPPTIFGDGGQTRDFVFVEDVVQANRLACYAQGAAGEIFNIGSGGRTTISSLAGAIRDLIGSHIEPVYEQERIGDVRHSQADISKAREILGYEPLADMKTALDRTIKWFKTNIFCSQ